MDELFEVFVTGRVCGPEASVTRVLEYTSTIVVQVMEPVELLYRALPSPGAADRHVKRGKRSGPVEWLLANDPRP